MGLHVVVQPYNVLTRSQTTPLHSIPSLKLLLFNLAGHLGHREVVLCGIGTRSTLLQLQDGDVHMTDDKGEEKLSRVRACDFMASFSAWRRFTSDFNV